MKRDWWIDLKILGLILAVGILGGGPASAKPTPPVPAGLILERMDYVHRPNDRKAPTEEEWRRATPIKPGQSVDLGFNHRGSTWVRVVLYNPTQQSVQTALALPNIHLDTVEAHYDHAVRLLGDETPSIGPYLGNIGFVLNIEPHEHQTAVLRLRKDRSFVDFQINMEQPRTLERHTSRWTLGYAFFLSLVLVLMAINVLLWLQTRRTIYLNYLISASFSLLYTTVNTGMGKFVIFPTGLWFSELRIYSGLLWFAAIAPFIRDFLELPRHFPKANRLLQNLNRAFIATILASTYLIFVPDSGQTRWFMAVGYSLYVVMIGSHAFYCVRSLKTQRESALYALVAFMPLMFYGVVHVMDLYLVESVVLPRDFISLVTLFEALLFGLLLAKNYLQAFRNESNLRQALLTERETTVQVALDAQIRERTTVAHALHDQFGGTLAALLHQARQTSSLTLVEGIDQLAGDIRTMAHSLMPRALEDGALVSALENQLNIVQKQGGIQCVLQSFDAPERIDPHLAQNLYLIALELIQNGIKHGKATELVVEIYGYPDVLVLQVADNGQGFDTGTTAEGFGLQSLRSRLARISGEIDLNSQPGEGTHVLIQVPLASIQTV